MMAAATWTDVTREEGPVQEVQSGRGTRWPSVSARRWSCSRELLRIDTTNPPGNETQAAEFLASGSQQHGLEGEIVGEPAHRRSFVLRLEGSRPGPTITLLAHTDVVPAEADNWTVPPFSGEVRDDYVWGRGAADIKNLVAAHAVAVRRLAASGCDFAGTVIYAATADEEEGTVAGAKLAHRAAARPRALRLPAERGRRRVPGAAGRPPPLRAADRREGHGQFKLTVKGRGRARLGAAAARQRRGRRGRSDPGAARLPARRSRWRPCRREYVELLVDDEELRRRLLDETTARDAARGAARDAMTAPRAPARAALRRHLLADHRALEQHGGERLPADGRALRRLPHAGRAG
jgi:hypothetical protein